MRITVNLSLFFHDHRSLAKLFINENIKRIKDVESRISEIFKIKNFYLKCENQYLPPSEDVHILNHDDIVWVLPKNADDEEMSNGEEPIFHNQVEIEMMATEKKKKKKKKKQKEVTTDNEVAINITKKRHSKKRKRDREESPERATQISDDTNENHNSKCKKIKSKLKYCKKEFSTDVAEDSVAYSKDSGRDSFDSSKSDETENQSQSISVKSLVSSFEKNKHFKKCMENSFTPIEMKNRTNIVKTIIVSDNKNVNSETGSKLEQSTDSKIISSNVDFSQSMSECTPTNTQNEKYSEKISQQEECSVSHCDSFGTENSDMKIKRKRKRVRKRKHINKNDVTLDNSKESENSVLNLIPRPLLTKTASGRHVRFKENSEVIPSPVIDNNEDNNKILPTDSVISNESGDAEKENALVEPPTALDVTKVINDNDLTEEFILKQPVMKDMLPRPGDIIAFKILRISENYTPEVSQRIVGKVSNYDLNKADVAFDILYGKEQCIQPQGKFSVEDEEMTPEDETENAVFECSWSTLIDPRLLYP